MLGGFGASTLDFVGSLGLFWTSSGDPTSSIGNSAYRLYFMEGQIIVKDGYRGQSGLVLPFEWFKVVLPRVKTIAINIPIVSIGLTAEDGGYQQEIFFS